MTSRSPVSARSNSSRMLAGLGRELRGVDPRARRHGEGGDHAGHRRVHAGLVDEVPQHRAQARVDAESPHAEPVRGDQRQQRHGRAAERGPVHRRGVEEGDHQHRGHVVDDRQRGQEHLEPGRRAGRHQRQHAQGEGDVGGRRDRPAAARLGRGQRQVEARPGPRRRPGRRRRAGPPGAGVDSSPTSSSRLISRPTSRKNTAISASFTHCCAVSDSGWASGPTTSRVCQNAS